ncbi:MAG: hypothetical protein KIT35_23225 [Piscinibacter sp.]|uniref:hypothetical protein n=1 Tax=Piscinibacter sp. TaxID=1903157 RepID=UPI00258C84AB|nr:hypothetical protein [Piscinibacter sp.]MCW5666756.1 hypothetical protein [Piscinibacter sp.]
MRVPSAARRRGFALGRADIDICHGVPNWPDLVVEPLFEERFPPPIQSKVSVVRLAARRGGRG